MSLIHCNTEQLSKHIWNAIFKTGFREAVKPKKIRQDGRVTVVFWSDGTTTAVRRSDDDADNLYNAFCAALAKKVFGNNTALKRAIDTSELEIVNVEPRTFRYTSSTHTVVHRANEAPSV